MSASKAEVQKLADGLEARFGHIADHTSYAKGNSGFGAITSVRPVYERVKSLFVSGKRAEAVTLTQELLDIFVRTTGVAQPRGSLKADWFNLSAVLGQRNETPLALAVCLAGLEQQNGGPVFTKENRANWRQDSPPDDDLMAHAIHYATTVNDPRLSELLVLSGYDKDKGVGRVDLGMAQLCICYASAYVPWPR